jgi:hypothetical protein
VGLLKGKLAANPHVKHFITPSLEQADEEETRDSCLQDDPLGHLWHDDWLTGGSRRRPNPE